MNNTELITALESFASRKGNRKVEDWNTEQAGRIEASQRDLVAALNELVSKDRKWLEKVYAVAEFLDKNDATKRVLDALQSLLIKSPEDVDTAHAYDLSEVLEDAVGQFARANPSYDRPDVEPEQESRRFRRSQ